MGAIGTWICVGGVLGAVIGAVVFGQISDKTILTTIAFVYSISVLLFTWTTNYYPIVIVRFISGICQVFVFIYQPVFIDAFYTSK